MTAVTTPTADPTPSPTPTPTQIVNILWTILSGLQQAAVGSLDWWKSMLVEILSAIAFVVTLFHPGFSVPAIVQALVPTAAVIAVAISGAVKIVGASNKAQTNARIAADIHMHTQQLQHETHLANMQLAIAHVRAADTPAPAAKKAKASADPPAASA